MSVQSEVEPASRMRSPEIGAGARVGAILAGLPAWAWLTGIVAVSTCLQIRTVGRIVAPHVFGDELVYSELGRSFAATGHFALRGVANSSYGVIYPILIAPAYALSKNLVQAYAFVKAINAVLMSLAAIPTFFIARRVLSRNLALLASGFAVAIPSLAYTGMVMTENAFYPAFLLCVLTMMRAAERPTAARQLVVLGAIGFTFLIRAQAVVLIPAYLAAILLFAWPETEHGKRRQALRRVAAVYRPTWLLLVTVTALVLMAQIARGHSPMDILGAYRVVAGDIRPLGIPRWFLYHLADLDLYLGIIPFAACCIVLPRALRGLHGHALRLFSGVTISITFSMVLLVSAFSSSTWGLGRLHERNLFYVAPLLLIAFLAWFELGSPKPRALTLGAALIAAALPPALPFASLVHDSVVDALGMMAWATTLIRPGVVPLAMAVFSVTLASLFLLLPRRLTPILVFLAIVNVLMVGKTATVHAENSAGVLGSTRVHRDWIDAAVGPNADVAAIWFPGDVVCTTGSERVRRAALWQNEFFNRSIRDVYYVDQPAPDNLPAQRLSVEPKTHLLIPMHGKQFSPRFLAVVEGVKIQAPVVAVDPQTRTVLYRFRREASVVFPRRCPAFAAATAAG